MLGYISLDDSKLILWNLSELEEVALILYS